MKTSGRCIVAIENKKGDFWQVALEENGQALVIQLLEKIQGGKIIIVDNKLPLYFPDKKK